MKRINKNGFTLIEILAVIIILGILMIIAVPSVSKYILGSRDSAFVTSIQKYINAAINEVTSYEYSVSNTDTTYYIPTKCLATENGDESPYGKMEKSYVVVITDEGGTHTYYYIGRDETDHGMQLTKSDEISVDKLRNDVKIINTNQKVGGRQIIVVYSDKCDKTFSTTTYGNTGSTMCGKITGQSTTWTTSDRTITVRCQGNCKQTNYSSTFTTTMKEGIIQIQNRDEEKINCRVNVYIDKVTPTVSLRAIKKTSRTAVSSGTSSDEGLYFTFTLGTYGPSGATIKYCKDSNNTCIPNTTVDSNKRITTFGNTTGTYYIRYRVSSGAGIQGDIMYYQAIVE